MQFQTQFPAQAATLQLTPETQREILVAMLETHSRLNVQLLLQQMTEIPATEIISILLELVAENCTPSAYQMWHDLQQELTPTILPPVTPIAELAQHVHHSLSVATAQSPKLVAPVSVQFDSQQTGGFIVRVPTLDLIGTEDLISRHVPVAGVDVQGGIISGWRWDGQFDRSQDVHTMVVALCNSPTGPWIDTYALRKKDNAVISARPTQDLSKPIQFESPRVHFRIMGDL